MSGYVLTPPAQADLDETWLYVARDRPEAADRLIDRIVEQPRVLAANPEIGESCAELSRDLRQSTVGIYVILYRPRPGRLEVICVIPGARDVAAELRRRWSTE